MNAQDICQIIYRNVQALKWYQFSKYL